jgi:protein CpxP
MKHAHKNLMIAALLAAFGLVAGAQTPPAPQPTAPRPAMARDAQGRGDPAKMQERMGRMQERMARRMAEFKQKLQLSPAQEGAWTSYVAALKPGNFRRTDRAEFARLTTPERIDRMRQRHSERMAEMDRRGEATKAFYAGLSPQQKKVFDDETARRGRGGHGHGGHHHHRG